MTVIISAGELKRRVTLQSRGSTKTPAGGQVTTWTDVATVFARIESRPGSEPLEGGAIRGVLSHVVRIRYRPGVAPAMRLLYGARTLNIASVVDVEEAHVALDLYCSEGLNQG